jgi:GDPmannose 4,6-dehydratase
VLGWRPDITFEQLMTMMVESDLAQATREREHGELSLASSW